MFLLRRSSFGIMANVYYEKLPSVDYHVVLLMLSYQIVKKKR